ncbi:hypothetical protein GQ54DRAFT_305064 [Martensiomyces pterosporus]|nr:hypothetical protein GQ54DRAFT_305064 [Martensiomyces pterosporus]
MGLSEALDSADQSGYIFPASYGPQLTPPYPLYLFDRIAAYVIGSIFSLLFLSLIIRSIFHRSALFILGIIGAACISASFFLRAIFGYSSNTDLDMYMSLYILHTAGAVLLVSNTLCMAGKWIQVVDRGRYHVAVPLWVLSSICAIGPTLLEILGIYRLYNDYSIDLWYTDTVLHLAAIATILGFCGIGIILTVWKACVASGRRIAVDVTILILSFMLVGVWAGFTLAQVLSSMYSIVNTNEVLWGVLGSLPLALVLFMWLVTSAPRRFRFSDFFGNKGPEQNFPPETVYTHG